MMHQQALELTENPQSICTICVIMKEIIKHFIKSSSNYGLWGAVFESWYFKGKLYYQFITTKAVFSQP